MASQFAGNVASNGPDPSTTEALAKILSELNEMKLKNAQLEQKVSNEGEVVINSACTYHVITFLLA